MRTHTTHPTAPTLLLPFTLSPAFADVVPSSPAHPTSPQSIDPILGKQEYSAKRIHDWTSSIVESVLKSLQAVNKPFKYVVTCIIMQKNGAGLHTASTCATTRHTPSLPHAASSPHLCSPL